MGKRRHEEGKDNIILRKIRRLEKKLRRSKRYRDRDRRSETPSSSSASVRYLSEVESISDVRSDTEFMEEDHTEPNMASVVNIIAPPSPPTLSAVPATSPDPATAPAPVSLQPLDPTLVADTVLTMQPGTSQQPDPIVPDEILEMLGEAKQSDEKLGEKIPKEISERWGKILLVGLAKEQKESLMDRMLIPENFPLARAPKVNPEVIAVLSDPAKNRDKRLEKSQNQLGLGIAGLVNITKDLIQSEMPKLDIIKKLSEISQILLDLHYEETMNRRKLLLPFLDKSFWNTTQGVKRETYLFGDKLGETIKTTKDIEKSSQQIKKPIAAHQGFHRKAPISGNARPPRQQSHPKTAAAPPNRYYEPQPSTSARRNTGPAPARPRYHKPPANKPRDHRRR